MLIKHTSCYRSYFGEFTRFTRVSRRHFSCILNFELSRGSGICLHSIRLVHSDILFKASLGKNYATLSTEQRRHYSLCKSRTKVGMRKTLRKGEALIWFVGYILPSQTEFPLSHLKQLRELSENFNDSWEKQDIARQLANEIKIFTTCVLKPKNLSTPLRYFK